MTGFYGTYHYTSPEMKKRYQLQERGFVDLYYNDLHCLQCTWKQMVAKGPKAQLLDYLAENNKKTVSKCFSTKNKGIASYFSLKLAIFQQNYKELLFRVEKEAILVRTVRKLFQKVQSKVDIGNIDNFSVSVNSQKVDSEEFYQIDKMFFEYQIKIQTNPLVVNFLQIIQQICESDNIFQQAWQQQQYKQRIYFFIDAYSSPDPSIQNQNRTKKLIHKIYNHIGNSEQASDTMKFRAVLLYYVAYFWRKENVEILEKIMCYFLLMHDDKNREMIEDKILSIFWKKQDWSEYHQRNFKYFIGHWASLNQRTSQECGKYTRNAEKVVLKSEAHTLQVELIKFIIDLKIKRVSEVTIKKYLVLLDPSSNQLSCQVNYFIKMILEDKISELRSGPNAFLLSSYKYKDHYLDKCQLLMNILKASESQWVFQIAKLFEKDNFLSRFPTLLHLHVLNLRDPEDLKKKIMISKDYLQIIEDSDSALNFIYLQALLSVSSLEYFENFVLNYFSSLQLSKIDNFEQLQNLHTQIFTILYVFINIQTTGVTQVGSNCLDALAKILLPFLEYSSEITPIYQTSIQSQTQSTLEKAQHKYRTRLNFIRFLILMLVKKEQETIDLMLMVFGQFQEFQSDLAMYSCLCFIAQNFTQKQRARIRETIIKMVPKLITPSGLETFIVIPRFLTALLKTHREMQLMPETFTYICRLCAFIQTKRVSFYLQIFLERVEEFIRTFSRSQLQYFVKSHIRLELAWFSGCFVFTKFLHLAGKLLLTHGNQLETNDKIRLNTICVYFVREMPEGCHSSYRKELYHESYQINSRNTTTLSHIRNSALSTTMFIFWQSKFKFGRKQRAGPECPIKSKGQNEGILPSGNYIKNPQYQAITKSGQV